MPNKRLIHNMHTDEQDLDYTKWSPVLIDNLSPEDQDLFSRRKAAVEAYLKNEISVKEICKASKIERTELFRLIKRCFQLDGSGSIWGYRALIPRNRINKYVRTNITKDKSDRYISNVGLFENLLEKHPYIKEKIISIYFDLNNDTIKEPIIKLKNLHKKFLDECRIAGIKQSDYPFNTQSLGRISLYRFIKKLENEYFYQSSKRHGDAAARHARTTGIGTRNSSVIVRPFERVQFDGHRIDVMISISFKTPEGDEITAVIERIWLLVIIDVATRVILGHYISLNREYTTSDVLHCIRNAVLPKKLKTLTIPGLKYPENEGYHSLEIPETAWGLWEEFCYDNAKANLSNLVRSRLTRIVECAVNPGPVNMPERRGIIERFFGILEENGYHRIVSTTGSNPDDPRRKNPEKKAVKYKITAEELEELTDVFIANYNHTENAGINYLTPIECMKKRVSKGMIPRLMHEEKRSEVAFLTLQDQRVIVGNIKKGKRPYINYEGVEYRNDILARSAELIGTKLDLLINVDDIRSIRAFLPNGSEFGTLTAVGKWGLIPHTLQVRKQINRLRNKKLLNFTYMDDPIEAYHKYLLEKSVTNKSERNKLAELQKKLKSDESSTDNNVREIPAVERTLAEKNKDAASENSTTIQRKVFKTIIF